MSRKAWRTRTSSNGLTLQFIVKGTHDPVFASSSLKPAPVAISRWAPGIICTHSALPPKRAFICAVVSANSMNESLST